MEKKLMTSAEWWSETKADPEKINIWLAKQYHGEVLAAKRIIEFRDQFAPVGRPWHSALHVIATQEEAHAAWISKLLIDRGLTPQVLIKDERYWNQVLHEDMGFEEIAAAAAHAEKMRLERIQVICDDETADPDILEVFRKIYWEEKFHAEAFSKMAGDEALVKAASAHEDGKRAIGLIIEDHA